LLTSGASGASGASDSDCIDTIAAIATCGASGARLACFCALTLAEISVWAAPAFRSRFTRRPWNARQRTNLDEGALGHREANAQRLGQCVLRQRYCWRF